MQTPTTTSVLAARKAVQSTSELFAQMSQTLPGHIDIGTDIREHEEKVKRELKDEEVGKRGDSVDENQVGLQLAHHLQSSASFGSVAAAVPTERKKRKYERKIQKGTTPGTPVAIASPLLQTPQPVTPSSSSSELPLSSLASFVIH